MLFIIHQIIYLMFKNIKLLNVIIIYYIVYIFNTIKTTQDVNLLFVKISFPSSFPSSEKVYDP